MIKFQINAIGKLKNKHILALLDDYTARISNHLEICEFELKKTNNISIDVVKHQEAELLQSKILKNAYLIAMDEAGETLTSHEFANLIEQVAKNGTSAFVFFIGGAHGLSSEIKNKSDKVISLGKITLPHMLARLILVEQIYRAEKITNNHPYDK
ncbi:MAG: 23S rRNA (pseudouridine(1915)-N(3))-methyltransferase RlmH [Alphaproteobacteria bacterium]|nr:23S rRNA (pseudouridine(1915)-N(3))-methyltransferase RlmH [Alphaproteobacteria bacterium]